MKKLEVDNGPMAGDPDASFWHSNSDLASLAEGEFGITVGPSKGMFTTGYESGSFIKDGAWNISPTKTPAELLANYFAVQRRLLKWNAVAALFCIAVFSAMFLWVISS